MVTVTRWLQFEGIPTIGEKGQFPAVLPFKNVRAIAGMGMTKRKTKQSRDSTEFFIDFANGKYIPKPRLINPNDPFSKRFVEKRAWDPSKIPEARSKLKNLLDQIIQAQALKDSEALQYFIKIEKQYVPNYRLEKEKLVKDWQIGRGGVEILFYPDWLRDLSSNLISFLKGPEKNMRRLKKCPYCHEFYFAKHLKREKCYSDDCRKTYERIKKQKQRSEDIARYY